MRWEKFDSILVGVLSILLGIFHILNFIGLINIDIKIFLSAAFILYGIIIFYRTIGGNQRGKLFFASTLFLIGITLFAVNQFELINHHKISFIAFLFILGADLIILFIDNSEERVFLISGVLIIILSYLSLKYYNHIPVIPIINNLSTTIMDIWQYPLILIGVIILATHKW